MNTLITKIQPILQRQQKLMAMQAILLKGQVDEILAQRSEDVDKIDHLMDDLFAITPHSGAVEDIKRLNRYLATIDTEAAEYYAEKFREWGL